MKYIMIAFIFASVSAFSQAFEGGILYMNSVKSKNKKITDAQYTQMFGSQIEYFIKQGNYKYLSNGTIAQCQLYNNKENKVYTKLANSETVYWNDAAVDSEVILKSEVKKHSTVILKYLCDELILTCKSGVRKYYYTPQFVVNPVLFANHKYGNVYEVYKTSKSIILKTIIETPDCVMETVATQIKKKVLDNKVFYLPPTVKAVKSPF